jgi:hypothetical protein
MKHLDQVLDLLRTQIGSAEEVQDIDDTAKKVIAKCARPLSGGKEETNGLVYGLVQSGKTGVLTVTGAMGADEGYRTVIILTSDNDALYEQTLGRVRAAFPGMDILGKKDFKDINAFLQRIRATTCALVATKNASILKTLIQNFAKGNVKGLACLIIDDEADQASPNTKAGKDDGSKSKIYELITELRAFFDKNTYLQVTATPQGLFLQRSGTNLRPKFTVLSNPGHDYVGGEDFFADDSNLIVEFDLEDIDLLAPGAQPSPALEIPDSLLEALDTFMVGATYKKTKDPNENCAFLCHVSTRTSDHAHIERLLRRYKDDLAAGLKSTPKNSKIVQRLQAAYANLAATHTALTDQSFEDLLEKIAFFSSGIVVKIVNGETDEDVAVMSPYNLFVGGNKLGRGVTIKNLLVSYYGRNPKKPQADTVLQHARMYGYRRKDIGLLRLFLPPELHTVFKAINKMEKGLRDLIANNPNEEFRGIFVESGLTATRKNILAPGSIGVYSGGSNYNPAQVRRDSSVEVATQKIDKLLEAIPNKGTQETSIELIQELIRLTQYDQAKSEYVWNPIAVAESLGQFAKLHNQKKGFVYVDRDRGLEEARRETQGILAGGEFTNIPDNQIGLFLLRTKPSAGKHAAWWPQIRFPNGNYAFAFTV